MPHVPQPPRWTGTLLRFLIGKGDREARLADFEETFAALARGRPLRAARTGYGRLLLRSAPALLWASLLGRIDMLKSCLLLAWRNVRRQKLYILINIGGLALAMAGFLLMTLYAHREMGVDGFHENPDRTYRVIRRYRNSLGRAEALIGGTPAPLVPIMRQEMAAVADGARLGEVGGMFRRDDIVLSAEGLFADDGFLRVFRFPLAAGSAATVLSQPYALVLTRRLAGRLFGRDDPLGRTVSFSQRMNENRPGRGNVRYDLKVTGVMADPPADSHLRFEYLVSLATIPSVLASPRTLDNWGSSAFYSYVVLQPGTDPGLIDGRLAGYAPRFRGGDTGTYILQPLRRIHWEAVMDDLPGNQTNDPARLLVLSLLAVLILVVAGINAMNLAVARYTKRAKEIGLRKAVGARRGQLIAQFLGESLLLSFLAAAAALLLAAGLRPWFGRLVGAPLGLRSLASPAVLAIGLGMVLATGLLSGLYPALVLSSLPPALSLRGRPTRRAGRARFRRALVVLQFAFSVFLLSGLLVVAGQLRFIRAKDLGYDRENVVVAPLRDETARRNGDVIKAEILGDGRVMAAAGCEYVPLEKNNVLRLPYRTAAAEPAFLDAATTGVGFDFLDVFRLRLVQGRGFSRAVPSDVSSAVLVNEALVRKAGWADPVGRLIDDRGTRVIGVLADFHQSSLHDPIEPMVVFLRPREYAYLSVRLRPGDPRPALDVLRRAIEARSPDFPFEFYFQDDHAAAQYAVDLRFGRIFGAASVLVVLISGLGVFGLVSFMAERRTREIALRKVLGASAGRIARLLSLEYAGLAALACLPAWPAAWMFMNTWLQGFAYRAKPRPEMFVLAGAAVATVALATAGMRSLRAARDRPAERLRAE